VNVFDKNFKFLMEFGSRGRGQGQLIIPQQLAIDSNDRVYVIQEGNRGVSVFSMQYAN
jgi:DNA-binding beta-propeller fold protein YncE